VTRESLDAYNKRLETIASRPAQGGSSA